MKISSEFLNKYNVPGPRYTSYPPANFFHKNFRNEDYVKELDASNKQLPENISLYIHIPFCPVRCHFCGCNTAVGQKKSVLEQYVASVKKEINNVAARLDRSRRLTQIHWGGGTPNSISLHYIGEIMDTIRSNFKIEPFAEVAIECSPAYLEFEHIDQFADMGFNRMSLGIQDFREDVLEVVNRRPPKHPVKEIVDHLRVNGFKGINLDFIYGLPLQTVESFAATIEKALDIKPDRLVTFSYAHVPWVKEAQKKLEEVGLPGPDTKISMLVQTIEMMQSAAYIPIGIDHFARPDDELAKAYKNKKLHRNFQGYCTLETTGQVYGFGASSITQLWGAYAQNHKGITEYINAIEKDGFAIERGFALNKKQQVVRAVINSIMCNGVLRFDEIAEQFSMNMTEIKNILHFDADRFAGFIEDGLIEMDDKKIIVSEKGQMVARNIAMTLDPDLKVGDSVYSRTV